VQILDRRLGGGRFAAPELDAVAEWARSLGQYGG
jgi:hypothetical protein